MTAIAGYVICPMMLMGEELHVLSYESEYNACRTAVDSLQHICDVEETYESLIENYIEWESAISQQALRQMVSFEIGFNEVQSLRKLAARKLANLLASARLYLDSLPKHLKWILPANTGALAQIREATGIQYDARLSYRLMEALRNYSQHSALPIHGITTTAMRDSKDSATLHFALLPIIDREQLAQDNQFKKAVLDEISKLKEIELKPMVREYMEGLSVVHHAFRMITNPKRKSWIERLENTITRFKEQFPESSTRALAVLPVDSDGIKAGDEVYLAGPMVEYLEDMQLRYSTMVHFAKGRLSF